MKIAFVCAYYLPVVDGPGQVVHELARRYVKQGHDVHVFCSDSDKKKRIALKEDVIDGVKVHRCFNWFTLINFATVWPSIYNKIMESDFDIVHSHVTGHLYYYLSAKACKKKGIPHIHTTHCPWTKGFRGLIGDFLANTVYNLFMRTAYKLTDRIVAITPWELDFIKEYTDKKITVIPNGVDGLLFNRIKNNNFRKRHGIPANSKLVLFFGRINPTKGPEMLARAGKLINKEMKNVTFVWVGPDEGQLAKLFGEIKGENNMKYHTAIREKFLIAEMYQASDVYVLPSYREGLPLTIFEAMASGLPIIATPVNGVPYEIKEGVNGLLVEYGNVEGLKNAIIRILKDEKLAKKLSKNNVEKARNYDWDLIAERYMKVYKDVIKNKSR